MKNYRGMGNVPPPPPRYVLIGNRVKILREAGNSVYPYIRQGGTTNNYSLALGLRPFPSHIHWMRGILSDHPLVLRVIPHERRATHHDDASPCSRFHLLRMLQLIYLNSETVRNEDEGLGMERGAGERRGRAIRD